MTVERDHNISPNKINPRIGEVTITVPDRLQLHDKIQLSRIFADNPDQVRLTLQCLTGLEIETRATIYPTTKIAQIPTTVTNQT